MAGPAIRLSLMVLALGLLAGLPGCAGGDGKSISEESQKVAENFLKNTSTFKFDGLPDTIKLVAVNTQGMFTFAYQTGHPGHGDRSGLVLIQVVTNHRAEITVERGKVTSAVCDGIWDMIADKAVGQAVQVQKGQTFDITLDANPTTGYSWKPEYEPTYLKLVDRRFQPSSGAVGAGGKETFTFQALQVGQTQLRMLYQRPWEPQPLLVDPYRILIIE